MGIAKSVSSVMKHHFWWHGIYSTARQICRTCRGCQFAKAQRSTRMASNKALYNTWPDRRWTEISADYVGPLTLSPEGYTMLVVVMCHFTKFVQLIPMRSKTAKATAAALFYNVFLVHGFPTKLTTDRGTEFISAMQMEMCKLLDIHKLTTSPYRPQCDGRNENSQIYIQYR